MKHFYVIVAAVILTFGLSDGALSSQEKKKELPPGLQKQVERGRELPPGWQRKLVVGEIVDQHIYDRGRIILREDGHVTINVEGEIFRVIENTREIVEIIQRSF
ncbi:hypothetical protein QGM61_07715 [Pseudohongiella sp. SYSU M77423]|uniref:hypothetical protein n=1 Tax=Pseudohongiella sp. SYSU M77423 TaxID=3042312 RepID=UPI0024811C02|nr:hypothetical protein [Pseudohongiella sp. SYSU M77423]MDH7943705.1 hypothetical protein [Pseudohongiella sp. SYSU M77423]